MRGRWSCLVALATLPLFAQQPVQKPVGVHPAPDQMPKPRPGAVHGFTLRGIDGKDVPLATFRGKVLLLVNVASKCGLTPQYKELQALHERFAKDGFAVLGFPANDFLGQEPGSNEEIARFCSSTYGVTFPLFAKIAVKGEEQAPLYRYLTKESPFQGEVQWNFQKYLVDREGNVIARFAPRTRPDDPKLVETVEAAVRGKAAPPPSTALPKAGSGPAADALRGAVARAAREDKVALVWWSADWCGWCKKFEAYVARPEIATILGQDFVLQKLTTDHMADGEATRKHYADGKETGIPFLVWLDGQGQVVGRSLDARGENIGHPAKPEEIEAFMAVMRRTAQRATPEQIALLQSTLVDLAAKR